MDWLNTAWSKVVEKIDTTSLQIGDDFPDVSIGGKYQYREIGWWTNGFWPGILWLIYSDTKNERLREIAISCEQKMDIALQSYLPLNHDIGFMWSLTSVANYKVTQDESAKLRGLIAASHLASRFNLAGRYIRAWQGDGERVASLAIIDCLMNLPILFWASEMQDDPRFKHIAMAHADTVLKEFIREDGSVHHMVFFDCNTGERKFAEGGQGYSENSSWSRGNAWAIYGMALCYKYTKEVRYLDAAKKVSHYFISCLPEDKIAVWDFRAPITKDMPLDTSASAVAACGLLTIASLVSDSEKQLYYNNAKLIVKSLYENYGAWEIDEQALILKASGSVPHNSNINVPYIFGDYFFVEALSILRGNNQLFW